MKTKFFVISEKKEKVDSAIFLFPLKDYTVGSYKEYSLEELDNDSYIYINRILDSKEIETLKELFITYRNKIKGVFFEDLGILEIIKESKLPFETYFYGTHAICSKNTAESFLSICDYVVISQDVTFEEASEILTNVNHTGALLYGRIPYMYSRRNLVSNYVSNYELENTKELHITEPKKQKKLSLIENKYGTMIYDSKIYDGRILLSAKASFYILDLTKDDIKDFNSWWTLFFEMKEIPDVTEGFLKEKMITKLPPKEVSK